MSDDVAIAVIAGLGAMFAWGFADFLAKFGIDRLGDHTTLFWSQFAGVAPLIVLLAVQQNVPDLDSNDFLTLIALGAISATSFLFLYNAFGKGKVSLVGPISSSFGAGAVLLSVVLYNAEISNGRAIAIAVALSGIVLIGTETTDIRALLRREGTAVAGLREALIAMAVCSLFFASFEHFLDGRDWVFFLLVIRASASVFIGALAFVKRTSLAIPREHRNLWPILLMIALADVGAFSFVSYGFAHSSQFSIVAVLSSTFSLVTIVLARIFLKEHMTKIQVAGACVILTGIALVAAL